LANPFSVREEVKESALESGYISEEKSDLTEQTCRKLRVELIWGLGITYHARNALTKVVYTPSVYQQDGVVLFVEGLWFNEGKT
jgi:hypothetical protein